MKEKIIKEYNKINKMIRENAERYVKKLGKKNIFAVALIITSFITLIVALYSVNGKNKEWILEKFPIAIEKNDINLLSKCIRVDGEKTNDVELQPLLDYFIKNKEKLNGIIKEISKNGYSGVLTLQYKEGMIKDSYYLDIDRVDVEVHSNVENVTIDINGRKYNSGELIDDILPGTYKIKYTLNTEFGEVKGEVSQEILKDTTVEISIDATNITIFSEFVDAEVFIGGKPLNKKVEEVVNFGPIPTGNNTSLHIEKDFPWGRLKSNEVLIDSSGVVKVEIDMKNDTLMESVNSVLNGFFNSVFEALNKKDKELIELATSNVKNKIYDDILKKSFIFSDGYTISDLRLNIENSEFIYNNGNYKGNLVVNVNYDIYKKLLPFLNENNESMFLVTIEYENDGWNVVDIQKFQEID